MEEKHNATCSICGNSYYACLSCKDAMKLHPWKMYCCSADCYKAFQLVRGFSTGVYTKNEFKSKLKNIDLSNLDNYREHIKALIKDALKENKTAVVEAAKKDEDAVVENIVETEVENTDVVENVVKPIASYKKNYKVNNEVEKTE